MNKVIVDKLNIIIQILNNIQRQVAPDIIDSINDIQQDMDPMIKRREEFKRLFPSIPKEQE